MRLSIFVRNCEKFSKLFFTGGKVSVSCCITVSIENQWEVYRMKCLNKEVRKFLLIFLVLFLFQPGLSIAQGNDPAGVQSLDKEAQEFICVVNTSSLETQSICLEDKVSIERVVVCEEYTSTFVAEALCLKNRALSSIDVLKCFMDTPKLIEQICLVGSEISSRVISHFEATGGDLPEIIKEIEKIETEMEALLNGYKVRFDITQGGFSFHND